MISTGSLTLGAVLPREPGGAVARETASGQIMTCRPVHTGLDPAFPDPGWEVHDSLTHVRTGDITGHTVEGRGAVTQDGRHAVLGRWVVCRPPRVRAGQQYARVPMKEVVRLGTFGTRDVEPSWRMNG